MTITYASPDILIRSSAELGEGPVWVEREQGLSWVDLTRGRWHLNDPSTNTGETVELGGLLGAVFPSSNGGWIAANDDGFLLLDAQRRVTQIIRSLPAPNLRSNDAKCDARGRLWAGSVDREFQAGAGALHRLDADLNSSIMLEGLTQPNGLGWNPDNTRFYLIDTRRKVLLDFPFDLDDGTLGSPRKLVSWDTSKEPDGLAVDAEGCLWVAMWGSGEVERYSPRGELLGTVPCPVSKPTSCAILPGGTLVITSASIGSDLNTEPYAGSVLALDIGVGAVPVASFADPASL